jgi:hypothetical protein
VIVGGERRFSSLARSVRLLFGCGWSGPLSFGLFREREEYGWFCYWCGRTSFIVAFASGFDFCSGTVGVALWSI